MLKCADFFDLLVEAGIASYAGVPDSLLKDFCAYLTDHARAQAHCITANEGAAVALATGRYLATGKIGMVYLQNSGLGNIINPVTSLIDAEVYAVPVLFLIGWRGEPGVKDEPQHVKQGKNMLAILDAAGIPHAILPGELAGAKQVLNEAETHMRKNSGPYALIVRKGTFEPYELKKPAGAKLVLRREEAIDLVLKKLEDNAIVVSTTGMISREVFECRAKARAGHHRDFLTVGSMGHACQVALGVALEEKKNPVYCLDGDGALLMHMGSAAVLAAMAPGNLTHIVLNNGAHDSVGGQPTVGFQIDLRQFAVSVGYKEVAGADTLPEIAGHLERMRGLAGPKFLEIKVALGSRPDLGRPTIPPQENKVAFMRYLQEQIHER